MSMHFSIMKLLSLLILPSAEQLPGMALGLEALVNGDMGVE